MNIGTFGVCIVRHNEIIETAYGYFENPSHSSTTSELQAILEGLSMLQKYNPSKIIINSDCDTAINLLTSGNNKQKFQFFINELKKYKNITIVPQKIKAHSGHIFNNKADNLCKKAQKEYLWQQKQKQYEIQLL